MIYRCLILFFMLLVLAAQARGQEQSAGALRQEMTRSEVTVSLELSRGEMTTADRVVLTLSAAAPQGAQVRWPEIGDRLGALQVTARREEPAWLDSADRLVTRRSYTLEPMLAGGHVLPPLRFDLVAADGSQDQIVTEAMPLRVESLLPAQENAAATADQAAATDFGELRGVAAPPTPIPAWAWALLALSLVVGAGLALVLVRLWRGRPDIPAPADAEALQALDALLGQDLIEQRAWDAFFSQLSRILRAYIEARFHLHAPQRSTEEFLREARGAAAFAPAQEAQLDRFLRRADLVKFAGARVEPAEAHAAAAEVRAFVVETRSGAEDKSAAPSAAKGGG